MSTDKYVQKYTSRLDALCAFVERYYGVDPTHTKLLAAVLLPSAPYQGVWMLCGSPKAPFWEHFSDACERLAGGEWGRVENIGYLKAVRPRYGNERAQKWLKERAKGRILHDPYWKEVGRKPHPRSLWPEVINQCLRVEIPVYTVRIPPFGAEMELFRLLKLVVDAEFRPFLPIPLPNPPELMIYQAQILSKLNPELSDLSSLVRNITLLPTAHAVLHGRQRTEEEDWQAVVRVIRQSIRYWTFRILRALAESDGSMDMGMLEVETLMKRKEIRKELLRLWEEGIVGGRGKWANLETRIGADVRELVTGRVRWWETPPQTETMVEPTPTPM